MNTTPPYDCRDPPIHISNREGLPTTTRHRATHSRSYDHGIFCCPLISHESDRFGSWIIACGTTTTIRHGSHHLLVSSGDWITILSIATPSHGHRRLPSHPFPAPFLNNKCLRTWLRTVVNHKIVLGSFHRCWYRNHRHCLLLRANEESKARIKPSRHAHPNVQSRSSYSTKPSRLARAQICRGAVVRRSKRRIAPKGNLRSRLLRYSRRVPVGETDHRNSETLQGYRILGQCIIHGRARRPGWGTYIWQGLSLPWEMYEEGLLA